MKFTEFISKSNKYNQLAFYILSGSECFLKRKVLSEIKKSFFGNGGEEQGLIVFHGKEPQKKKSGEHLDGFSPGNRVDTGTSYCDIFEEIGTVSMFGRGKLIIVENADNFLNANQQKLLELMESSFNSHCLVLNVESLDKRKKIVKVLSDNRGIHIECHKLYDSPSPWERGRPEYDSELTKWIVLHAKEYKKVMNQKTAYSLVKKTGSELAIIDKQLEILSLYMGDRELITEEDIQNVLGVGQREKIYHLLDAVGKKDFVSAMKAVNLMFDTGMENERKHVIFDDKVIAIAMISALHKRMKELWKTLRVLDKGGGENDVLEKTSQKRAFVSKIMKQARNFIEEEMPDKWKCMLEADLLCKTSKLAPPVIIEQLMVKLCR
ncbi:MAG: DNA polymerase III subunit delta [Candidatus Scalindua sp.]|nr:DNA polymerase III subunit delta [Candidatus Scalindua sp.]